MSAHSSLPLVAIRFAEEAVPMCTERRLGAQARASVTQLFEVSSSRTTFADSKHASKLAEAEPDYVRTACPLAWVLGRSVNTRG